MKKNSLIILLLLISFSNSFSQGRVYGENDLFRHCKNVEASKLYKTRIKGDFYMNKKWKKGKFYSKVYKSLPSYAKYNYYIFRDEIHLSYNNDTVAIPANNKIDSILIDNHKFIYTSCENGNKIINSYFEELQNGNIKLLKKYKNVFVKNNNRTTTGYETFKPDRYVIKYDYYYQHQGESAKIIKIKKQDLLNLFSDHRKEMEAFLKKNRYKNQKHLINVFKYYNSL